MASSEISDSRDRNLDITELETELKKNKARDKTKFTRYRNKMFLLLEEQDLPSRRAVQDACEQMDNCLETAMEVMTSLLDLYIQTKALDKGKKIVIEMEKMEAEFYIAYEVAREYLDSQKEHSSSVSSDILSIDLQRMNIPDRSKTYKQVAQRATIAHLSPMCQGQISFQKIRTHPSFNACSCYMKVSKDPIKNNREKVETPFSPL